MLKFSGRNRPGPTGAEGADISARPEFGETPHYPGARGPGGTFSTNTAGQRFSAIDLRSSLSSAVRSLMAHAPHTEGPSDDVVKTVTSQISAVSDDVVDATADLLKNGSRSTIFGILAGTLVLGWIIGRSGQPPKFT
jgi:hypothetical protein